MEEISSRAYYIHFHIQGMDEDYCGRPIPSAIDALKRVRKLVRKYGFRITRVQERKGKSTIDISIDDLERLCGC